MTSSAGRVYVAAGSLLLFFVTWATVAAHPWAQPSTDPRLEALARREARVQREAAAAQERAAASWAAYLAAVAERSAATPPGAPPGPAVRTVTVPPITTTHTS